MKNKNVVKLWLVGIALSAIGGFISGYNGYEDGLSSLLTVIGYVMCLIFVIIGMIRLWKLPEPAEERALDA